MVVTDIVDAAIPRIMKNAAVGQLIRSEQNIQKLMFDSIKQIHKIALKNNATMKKCFPILNKKLNKALKKNDDFELDFDMDGVNYRPPSKRRRYNSNNNNFG